MPGIAKGAKHHRTYLGLRVVCHDNRNKRHTCPQHGRVL